MNKFLLIFFSIYYILVIPIQLFCMEGDGSEDESIHYMDELYDDGYVRPHSIIAHWHSHEYDALKSLVESIVKYTVVPCHIDSKYMGAFKGRERVVVTFFEDGYIQEIPFYEFKNLILPNENDEMIFSIDGAHYTIDGVPVVAPDSASPKVKKKIKSTGFLSSILGKIKKK